MMLLYLWKREIKLPAYRFRQRKIVLFGCLCAIMAGCTCFTSESFSRENDFIRRELTHNGRINLSVQINTGLPEVAVRKNRFLWETSQFVPVKESQASATMEYWKKLSQSAFIIRYYNNQGNVETVYTNQSECQIRFTPISAGGSFTFDFQKYQIGFQAIYTLGLGNNLRVTIPFRKIVDPKGRLLDIRVLPYFGSLAYQSRGYLVMPDGCGGLIKPYHYPQEYKPARIYGERFYYSRQIINRQSSRNLHLSDYNNYQNSFLSLPIFGVVQKEGSFLGVITQGQFQAELGAEISPITLRTSVSPRLIFRETSYDILGRFHVTPIFDHRDRIVDYYFLDVPDTSYVDIAQKYRELLLTSMQPPRVTNTQFNFRLRLFMGENEQYLDTTRLICLTNFKQTESILKDLVQKGLRQLQIILVGWSNRGYLGDNPRHFPPDQQFGGVKGLKKLLETGKQFGIPIGLQFDNSFTFQKSHGFKRDDTVKDILGVPIDIGFSRKEYLLCPGLAWERFLKTDLQLVRKLKCEGSLLFDGLNQGLFNCYDKHHPVNYESMARLIRKSFQEISRTNPVTVTAAPDFLDSEVAAIYDLPARASDNCDETVPLLPIIYHGWLPYSFEPLNVRNDDRRGFLKMVEYGAIPNAYLTAEKVDELVYAKYNPISSGKYSDWRRSLIEEYQRYERDLRPLQKRMIVNHQSLDRDVFFTTYDDGSKTIVNYGGTIYSYGGAVVRPLDFVIMR